MIRCDWLIKGFRPKREIPTKIHVVGFTDIDANEKPFSLETLSELVKDISEDPLVTDLDMEEINSISIQLSKTAHHGMQPALTKAEYMFPAVE